MNRELVIASVLLVLFAFAAPIVASAEISVGVEQGDWIEYQVTYSGTPPEGHTVKWARIDVGNVQGRSVSLVIAAKMTDDSWRNETFTLNFDAGQLGDKFIIPADLNVGDTVFDAHQGDTTISGMEDRTCAGATRTVLSATTAETTYYWDKVTGVLLEGNSVHENFTMYTVVDRTSMWQSQVFGWDSTGGLDCRPGGTDSVMM